MKTLAILAMLLASIACSTPGADPVPEQEIMLFASSEDESVQHSRAVGSSSNLTFTLVAEYPEGTVHILATERLDWPLANGTLTYKRGETVTEYASRTSVASTGRMQRELVRAEGGGEE